jgi:hypothetical protein
VKRTAAFLILLAPLAARPARAERPDWLMNVGVGFGIEPHQRVSPACTKSSTNQMNGQTETVRVPDCNLVLAFGVGGELLWRGFLGLGLGLYASEGAPVEVASDAKTGLPGSFGDRISLALAVAVRPLAPLAWKMDGQWGARLLAGFGLQVGVSLEYARSSLDSALNLGFHGEAFLDLPVWGAGTRGGVAVRLAARVLASPDVSMSFVQPNQNEAGFYQVREPGTAAQLLAGVAYYR